jgi:hypothetical protein
MDGILLRLLPARSNALEASEIICGFRCAPSAVERLRKERRPSLGRRSVKFATAIISSSAPEPNRLHTLESWKPRDQVRVVPYRNRNEPNRSNFRKAGKPFVIASTWQ